METSKKKQAVTLLNQAVVLLQEYQKETKDSTSLYEATILSQSAARLSIDGNAPATSKAKFSQMPKRDVGATGKKNFNSTADAAEDSAKKNQAKVEEKPEQKNLLLELKAIGSGAQIGATASEEELITMLQWLGFKGETSGRSKTQLGTLILNKLKEKSDAELTEMWATYLKQENNPELQAMRAELAELKNAAQSATEEQKATEDYAALLDMIKAKEEAIAKLKG